MHPPGSASLNKTLVMKLQTAAPPYYIREKVLTHTSSGILIAPPFIEQHDRNRVGRGLRVNDGFLVHRQASLERSIFLPIT